MFTSGTKKNLKATYPAAAQRPKSMKVSEEGIKGDPFTRSNGKRIKKEGSLSDAGVPKRGDIKGPLHGGNPLTRSTQARQSDKVIGVDKHVKSIRKNGDFNSDTTQEMTVGGY